MAESDALLRIAVALERLVDVLTPDPNAHIDHDQSERLIAAQERTQALQERSLALEEYRLGLRGKADDGTVQ